jgi:outer membrane immunogenic protein
LRSGLDDYGAQDVHTFRPAFIGLTALLGAVLPALADGPPPTAIVYGPPPAAPIWSGFYAGIYGGNISGTSDATLSHNDPTTPGVTAEAMFGPQSQVSFSPTGATVALALGYNFQSPGSFLVWGFEADMAWASGTATARAVSVDTLTTWNLDTKLYSLGTLRARLGVATGPVLWYGTAGLAWGETQTNVRVSCFGCAQDPWAAGTSKTVSHIGGIIGGGVEYLATEYVVLRAEYLYVSLGDGQHTFNGHSWAGTVADTAKPGQFFYNWDGAKQDLGFSMWRIGASLKFYQ